METLRCLTSSLQDQAGLQKLRDNLQDIPLRWLSRPDGGEEDYLLGNVTGECNYHFTFKLEGGGYFQTGVLVASAESGPGGMPVALKCRWKRRIGDIPVEIPGVTSNMYQISADDVGTHIRVEAQPADADDGLFGTVSGEIGPFELDPATRRSLDNALGQGESRFVVSQSKAPGDDGPTRELVIDVSPETVRVAPQGQDRQSGKASDREVSAEFTEDYPKLIIHQLDTTKFQLVMNESRTFHLVASSRTSRDLIALTIRCFHAKRYLSTQSVLQELLPIQPLGPGTAASPTPSDGRLDACIVLEQLTKELNRTMQQKEVSEKVLRNTNNEKRQLQAQLRETISGFTEVIESIQDQFSDGAPPSAASVDSLQEQLREASQQSQALKAELEKQRKLLAQQQQARRSGTTEEAATATKEIPRLRQEMQLLQDRLKEISNSSGHRGQADQAHVQELKRLRQDVESLHDEKELLRKRLQDADSERQDLQDNFLYVKGQLDKVQMKQAHLADSDSSGSEVNRHRKILNAATEERNRLSTRLEGLLREVEKEKAYNEQSLERVMTANARLLEEKDRAAREVQRLSQLYAESVQQLQGQSLTGTYRPDALQLTTASLPSARPEEMTDTQARLSQVDEALKRKDMENESLKNRIRKLAVS